ncbi:hypothetical protein GCM10027292_27250 [Hydrogenophaga aquatica]
MNPAVFLQANVCWLHDALVLRRSDLTWLPLIAVLALGTVRRKKTQVNDIHLGCVAAEAVRFELTNPCGLLVFKSLEKTRKINGLGVIRFRNCRQIRYPNMLILLCARQ